MYIKYSLKKKKHFYLKIILFIGVHPTGRDGLEMFSFNYVRTEHSCELWSVLSNCDVRMYNNVGRSKAKKRNLFDAFTRRVEYACTWRTHIMHYIMYAYNLNRSSAAAAPRRTISRAIKTSKKKNGKKTSAPLCRLICLKRRTYILFFLGHSYTRIRSNVYTV